MQGTLRVRQVNVVGHSMQNLVVSLKCQGTDLKCNLVQRALQHCSTAALPAGPA